MQLSCFRFRVFNNFSDKTKSGRGAEQKVERMLFWWEISLVEESFRGKNNATCAWSFPFSQNFLSKLINILVEWKTESAKKINSATKLFGLTTFGISFPEVPKNYILTAKENTAWMIWLLMGKSRDDDDDFLSASCSPPRQQQEMFGKVINKTDASISLHALWIFLVLPSLVPAMIFAVQNYYHFSPLSINIKVLGKWKIRGSWAANRKVKNTVSLQNSAKKGGK